jgi:hypothetical protein
MEYRSSAREPLGSKVTVLLTRSYVAIPVTVPAVPATVQLLGSSTVLSSMAWSNCRMMLMLGSAVTAPLPGVTGLTPGTWS